MEHIFDSRVRGASLLATLVICSKSINAVIGMYYHGTFRIGILVLGSVWIAYFFYLLRFKLHIDMRSRLFLGFIMAYFILSSVIIGGYAYDLMLQFVEYGLLGFLVGQLDFDMEKVARDISYLLVVFAFPFYQMMQSDLNSVEAVISMTTSYAIMPMAMTTIAHFLFFRKRTNLLLILSYIFSFAAMLMLITRGTRGIILCLLTFLFLVIMNTKRRREHKYNPGTVVIIILIVFLVFNVNALTTMLNNSFTKNGIEINFLQKSVDLLNREGDIGNGRFTAYGIAFQGFLSSPIYGNGIGAFGNSRFPWKYPHNMFLQVLYEGGLLLGVPIILFTVWTISKALFGKINDDSKRIAMILFISCSIPAAMVTDELWNYQILWMLFGFFFKNQFFSKEKSKMVRNKN